MHDTNIPSLSPDGKKLSRHSMTDGGLEGIYKSRTDIANVGGGSAKDVGTSRAQTNFVDITQQFSDQFKVKNPMGFTGAAKNYSTDVLGLDNTKYAPSGRL